MWHLVDQKNNFLGRLRYEEDELGRWRITDLDTLKQRVFADKVAATWWLLRRGKRRYPKHRAEMN